MYTGELLDRVVAICGDYPLQQFLVLTFLADEFIEYGDAHIITTPAEPGHGGGDSDRAELVGESIDIPGRVSDRVLQEFPALLR
jgi:hypothetical protein